jgi:hypothetical protein
MFAGDDTKGDSTAIVGKGWLDGSRGSFSREEASKDI